MAVCAFYLLPVAVYAQEGDTQSEITASSEVPAADAITVAEQELTLGDDSAVITTPPPSGTSALGIIRVLLTLAVVAAAIYGLVFFIKKTSRPSLPRDPFLKVLAGTPLGNNRSAHIISVGSQAWLVGAAENGVNLISEITDKDILNAMFLEDSRRGAEGPGGRFPDFRALLGRLGKQPEAGAPVSPENIRKRSERLKGL